MKKKIITSTIAYISAAALLLVILAAAMKIMRIEYVDYTYGGYYDDDTDYDVLLVGSSRMINGVFPMMLWRDFGITSYNYGAHANLMPSTYWVVENALKYKNPKLVVVEVDGINSDLKYATPDYMHSWMDSFPMSLTKLRAITDLCNDPVKDAQIKDGTLDEAAKAGMGEYIWDYSKYHSRWNEIYEENFESIHSPEKGAEARVHVTRILPEGGQDEEKEVKEEASPETVGEEYLKRLIRSCRERGIEVMLLYLPCETNEEYYDQAETAEKIAEEYNVDYVNMLDDSDFDSDMDFYDAKHLNPAGAYKATTFIGQHILYNYSEAGVKDHRDEASDQALIDKWDRDYKEYAAYTDLLMNSADSLENALVLLSYEDYDSQVELMVPEELLTLTEQGVLEGLKQYRNVTIVDGTVAGDASENDGIRARLTIHDKVSGEDITREF